MQKISVKNLFWKKLIPKYSPLSLQFSFVAVKRNSTSLLDNAARLLSAVSAYGICARGTRRTLCKRQDYLSFLPPYRVPCPSLRAKFQDRSGVYGDADNPVKLFTRGIHASDGKCPDICGLHEFSHMYHVCLIYSINRYRYIHDAMFQYMKNTLNFMYYVLTYLKIITYSLFNYITNKIQNIKS